MTDLERCYLSAIRILKYRFNSELELRRKLAHKEFDKPTIAETIERLRGEKWLDDARFAGAYVRTRALKRIGKLRIRQELIRAGVADDVIADAIDGNVDEEKERSRARTAAEKKLAILRRRNDPLQTRNKLTAYLLKQGYDGQLVRAIVKEILLAQE
jgi:regulatory protein